MVVNEYRSACSVHLDDANLVRIHEYHGGFILHVDVMTATEDGDDTPASVQAKSFLVDFVPSDYVRHVVRLEEGIHCLVREVEGCATSGVRQETWWQLRSSIVQHFCVVFLYNKNNLRSEYDNHKTVKP